MSDGLKSAVIWLGIGTLVLLWLPLVAIRRLTDRDPGRYRTGRMFRRLGLLISRINPRWQITISGRTDLNDREPYVMVCNHLSQADIPLISNLPWDMKWVAKKELFSLPVVGWMMNMAGDIPVDRGSASSGARTMYRAGNRLESGSSVFFFPEGTRSRSGNLRRFSRGAFELAVRYGVPVLPMVIDGTQNCLPKKSWKFGEARHVRLKILDPVPVKGGGEDREQVERLRDEVRGLIRAQLSQWRESPPEEVDDTL